MKMNRISSNFLYHFKRDFEILLLILQNGFRRNSWKESIPFFGMQQQSFVVCFCDILFQESEYHRNCYGNNAIVLNKDWALKKGVSPVRYIHESSPGLSEDYMILKKLYRNSRELAKNPKQSLGIYLVSSLLHDDKKLLQGDIDLSGNLNPNVLNEANEYQKRLNDDFRSIENEQRENRMFSYLECLMDKIHKLHNELELRDSFLRAYEEDFSCPANAKIVKSKILYDEKEWRSIKFISESEIQIAPQLKNSFKDGFLPKEYNLTFKDEDIEAIIVEDESMASRLLEEITMQRTLLSTDSIKKIHLTNEYQE
jgi:hypothetical protein